MGIISSIFEKRATLENPSLSLSDPEAWRNVLGGLESSAGLAITPDKALTYSPVWQAIKMISGDASKLPLDVFRRLDGGGREIDTAHPAFPFINLLGMANEEVSALKLFRRLYAGSLLFENGYLRILRDNNNQMHGLYNLLPDRTAPLRVRGRLWYVTELWDDWERARLVPIPAEDVIHVEGLSFGGDRAPELVKQARHDFGLALAAREFTSKFFAHGAHLGGILQIPPNRRKEARDTVEDALRARHTSSEKAFKTMVLRDGYRWHATMVEPEKAQLVELDEQQVRHVARWFNLSPDRLGISESVSYNSLEQRKQDYLDSTLSYWLLAVKSECNTKLLTERERTSRSHFIDYNINALLWADAKTRSEIANSGIQFGRFSADETRAWENLNPRADGLGGTYLRPVNLAPAAEANKVVRTLLANALTRVVRRVGTHARRAAGDRQRYARWLETFESEHAEACRAMLADSLAVVRLWGAAAPVDVAGDLLAELRAHLAEVREAAHLPAAVDALVTRYESSGEQLAAQLITGARAHDHQGTSLL